MISKDYTKEVGLDSGTKTIPWPLAGVLLALVGVGVWFAVGEARAAAHKEEVQKAAISAQTKAADKK